MHEAFAPHEDTVSTVRAWLNDSGISLERIEHSVNKGWLHFHATTKEAEDLLQTKFYELEHTHNGKWAVGCDEYSLPDSIKEHVDYVTPGQVKSPLIISCFANSLNQV